MGNNDSFPNDATTGSQNLLTQNLLRHSKGQGHGEKLGKAEIRVNMLVQREVAKRTSSGKSFQIFGIGWFGMGYKPYECLLNQYNLL